MYRSSNVDDEDISKAKYIDSGDISIFRRRPCSLPSGTLARIEITACREPPREGKAERWRAKSRPTDPPSPTRIAEAASMAGEEGAMEPTLCANPTTVSDSPITDPGSIVK
ncbi:unnamed protein product, partial [Nesidiocoris tenuis]